MLVTYISEGWELVVPGRGCCAVVSETLIDSERLFHALVISRDIPRDCARGNRGLFCNLHLFLFCLLEMV